LPLPSYSMIHNGDLGEQLTILLQQLATTTAQRAIESLVRSAVAASTGTRGVIDCPTFLEKEPVTDLRR